MEWIANRRYVQLASCTFETLGSDFGTRVHHPLMAPRFLAALAAWGGVTGLGDRTRVMGALFGSLLPEVLLSRSSKATFNGAFWRSGADDFVQRWMRGGVDPGSIDLDELRVAWTSDRRFPATLLLQQAWLSADAC